MRAGQLMTHWPIVSAHRFALASDLTRFLFRVEGVRSNDQDGDNSEVDDR